MPLPFAIKASMAVNPIADIDRAKPRRCKRALAGAYLKAKGKKANVEYAELAKRPKKDKETESGITSKLKRGMLRPRSSVACLAVIELEGVVLEEI